MGAPEMTRCLMFLRVADRAQRTLVLNGHLTQSGTCKNECRRREHAPVGIALVMRGPGLSEQQAVEGVTVQRRE